MAEETQTALLGQCIAKLRAQAAVTMDISRRITLLAEARELSEKLNAMGLPLVERFRPCDLI